MTLSASLVSKRAEAPLVLCERRRATFFAETRNKDNTDVYRTAPMGIYSLLIV
jgi:hypothetical protein